MTKLELKKVKKVKKSLKKVNKFKEYKKIYKNVQMQFIFTKLSIIFESKISIENLVKIELSLLNDPTQANFVKSMKELSQSFIDDFKNLEWNNFAIFIWYSFQTSLFYNKRRKVPCEYTYENFIALNKIKRINFTTWLKSFYDSDNVDFNKYVINVLRNTI
ncbi:MAG: hypothetical protein KFW07_03940 [Mycoplasmataceae bacterium]|nr:hypothetical protein [Mycoplasmataceae bacterium]